MVNTGNTTSTSTLLGIREVYLHHLEITFPSEKGRNKRRTISTDFIDTKRITSRYYEQLYVNQLDNIDETDKVIENHKLPKITQEDMDNLKTLISI